MKKSKSVSIIAIILALLMLGQVRHEDVVDGAAAEEPRVRPAAGPRAIDFLDRKQREADQRFTFCTELLSIEKTEPGTHRISNGKRKLEELFLRERERQLAGRDDLVRRIRPDGHRVACFGIAARRGDHGILRFRFGYWCRFEDVVFVGNGIIGFVVKISHMV